jgi:hypothetical protein
MRSITQELSGINESFYLKKEDKKKIDGDLGEPENLKSTTTNLSADIPSIISRVKKSELELTYIHNPVVFNGINKAVQTIMSADRRIRAKNPKVREFFENFTANLGNSGSLITWEELLTQIFKHQCIFGGAFVENIFNKRGNRIVDWDIIDSKKIDYAKDSNGNVLFDKFGSPLGYTMLVPMSVDIPESKLKNIPSEVALPCHSFFIPAEKIAHIKLYSVGDGIYPVGLIEPIYKTSLRKLNMEDALANATYRHGFPVFHAKLGDQSHEPTPQQIQNMLKVLKDLNFKNEIATPYYYDIQILESKKAEKLREHLEYYKEQEIAGLGIPRPYVTGAGSDENRSVLDNMSNLFELTLRDIINITSASIRRFMFAPLAEKEGFDEVPYLEWDIIGVDEIDKKTKRIMSYIENGIIQPNNPKVLEFIKQIDGIE